MNANIGMNATIRQLSENYLNHSSARLAYLRAQEKKQADELEETRVELGALENYVADIKAWLNEAA